MSTSAANFKVVFNLKELTAPRIISYSYFQNNHNKFHSFSEISQDNIEVRLKILDKDFQV